MELHTIGLSGHHGLGEGAVEVFAPPAAEEGLAAQQGKAFVYDDACIPITGTRRLAAQDVVGHPDPECAKRAARIIEIGGGAGVAHQVQERIAPGGGLVQFARAQRAGGHGLEAGVHHQVLRPCEQGEDQRDQR